MIAQVAAMDDAAFLSWHAQTLTAWGSATEAQAVPPSRTPGLQGAGGGSGGAGRHD